MQIYNKQNKLILDIDVDDKSYRYRAIMGKNDVVLYYSLPEHVEIPTGSYIYYQGEQYRLWYPEDFVKQGSRNYEYTVTFISNKEYLKKCKFKLLSERPYKLKFPLTAKPRVFMQLIVDCLNLHDSGWQVGKCIDSKEIYLAFNHENCLEVLTRLADECNTEYEIVNKTLNLSKVEYFKDEPLVLSYGKGNGFKTGVGRTSQKEKQPVTILYVQGGERNIDYSIYGSKSLLLPRNQELEYQGRRYKTDADGTYIVRADRELTDYNEDSYDGSNHYPSRVGTVSWVETFVKNEGQENEYTLYDIIDESIPESLDYSQFRIAGETATIIFQSGILAGKEFDIEQTKTAMTGYVHSERRFKLVSTNIDGMTMPNDTFKPSPGDEYAVFHISLPNAYICDNASQTGASWDMFREAVQYMYNAEDDGFVFKGDLDGIWAKRKWLEIGGKIRPGGYVQFSDTQFQPEGVLIRTTGVRDYINNPHSPVLELSNAPVSGYISNEIGKIEENEVITDELHKEGLAFTQRRFRDAKEMQDMLEKAFLDFSAGVNPIWVQTMSLLVGEESLQFQFVDNKTAPKEVDHPFYYDNESKVFETPAGIIQHLTLGIDKLSSSLEPSDYKYWDISSYTSPPLTDQSPYYLYLICQKDGTTGYFTLSKEAHRLDPGDGNYYFLTGTLGADVDNVRSFATLYGFTEIGPGWMRVKQIISPDGKTYFNVAMGEIGGRIVLKAGSSGLKELAEWTGVDKEIKDAQKTADDALDEIDETNKALGDLNEYVDGAFADGIISEAEAIAIEKYINTLNKERSDIDAQYAKLFANSYLEGVAKTNLLNAKITFAGAHQDLINAINTAIEDKQTTVEEKNAVDAAFILYSSALATLSTRIQEANVAIQDKLKGFSDSALDQAHNAQNAADAAQKAADDANAEAEIITGVLNDWASDSFISPMEKTGLKQQLSDIQAEYQEIAGQATRYSLTNTTAWSNYYSAYLAAVNALNKYTASSPSDIPVQSDYSNISAYYSRRKTILEAIAAAAKKYVDDLANSMSGATAGLQELAYLKEAIANETTNIGGLLLTSLLKLGIRNGSTWEEKAGINGTAKKSSDVIAWFGGTLNQAINNTAAIVFRLNGSGQLAGGAIKWYQEKNQWNAEFEGIIKAKGMQIPFINIEESDAIYSNGSYILNGDLSVITLMNVVILPIDVKYNGSIVSIFNNVWPPYTKSFVGTYVQTQNRQKIFVPSSYEGLAPSSDFVDSICVSTGVVRLIAVLGYSDDMSGTECVRWVVLK